MIDFTREPRLSPQELLRLRGLSLDALACEREYWEGLLREFADTPADQQWALDGWRMGVAAIGREIARRRPGHTPPPATITPEHIARIKEGVSLEQELMDIGVTLHKSGRGLVGLCPFHSEKTPSFHVYPDGRYHCYGCGAHGDVITFIQQRTNMDFVPAVHYLALQAGVRLPMPGTAMRPLTRADGFTL